MKCLLTALTVPGTNILGDYLSGKIGPGEALEEILSDSITENTDDKRVAKELMYVCNTYDQRRGLIAVIRSTSMKSYKSLARKQMFFMDISSINIVK
jgi:hypothetical protein